MPDTESQPPKGQNDRPAGDPVAEARQFLAGLLERMGIEAEVEVREGEDKVILEIQCDQAERVIGRRGQIIDALQHLVGKVVSAARNSSDRGKPVVVDADGYRDRYADRLRMLAAKMSERAAQTGKEVRLDPMPARDRRIVHMAVAELTGVSTRSEGEGEDRHVVVVPASSAGRG